jgi:hypothetical protein
MKIFGYKDDGLDLADVRSSELAEITLVASPSELRRIAQFMISCADGMEARGKDWEHEHLGDKQKGFEDSPHFVVCNPEVAS